MPEKKKSPAARRSAQAIGVRVRALREAIGLSQREVGALLGRRGASVGAWERGETLPDLGIAADLARLASERQSGQSAAQILGWLCFG